MEWQDASAEINRHARGSADYAVGKPLPDLPKALTCRSPLYPDVPPTARTADQSRA
jgi:hypothetical protein